LTDLKRVLSEWQTDLHGKAWNSLYWDNHDQPRAVSRFGDDRPAFRVRSAKMLAATLHMMEGTPYIYQGEELGMTNIDFPSIHDYRDLDTLNAWHELVDQQHALTSEDLLKRIHRRSRDNARTPMQWDATQHAGFTKSTPWIKVNPNYQTINAAAALADPDSVFFFYQKLNQLRKQYPALIVYGDYELLDPDDPDVFMYRRFTDDQELLVINNFTDQEQSRPISTRLPKNARLMISNYADDRGDVLRPYETRSYLGERR
jgi:oligo-1,6-glucosidase